MKRQILIAFIILCMTLTMKQSYAQKWDGAKQEDKEAPVQNIISSAKDIGNQIAARQQAAQNVGGRVSLIALTPEEEKVDPALGTKYKVRAMIPVAQIESVEDCQWQRISRVKQMIPIPGINWFANDTCLKLNLTDKTSRRIVFDYVFDSDSTNQHRAQALKAFVEGSKDGRYQLLVPVLRDTRLIWNNSTMITDHPVNAQWSDKYTWDGRRMVFQDAPNDAFYASQLKILESSSKKISGLADFLDNSEWQKGQSGTVR